ncbi:MAG: hypothetical protein GX338_04400 [Firmicutes bacterium]|nr:hypothetical protein [Bacillota bacterium]
MAKRELAGIVGGMGPLATIELMRLVMEETPACNHTLRVLARRIVARALHPEGTQLRECQI